VSSLSRQALIALIKVKFMSNLDLPIQFDTPDNTSVGLDAAVLIVRDALGLYLKPWGNTACKVLLP